MRAPLAPPGLDREEAQALALLVALFLITAAWWSLALWPVDSAPLWLERTRYVCFGVNEHGLPDAGGWIGLIGGPLGMLLILSFGWSGGLVRVVRRARWSRAIATTLAALALGSVVLISGAAVRVQQVRAATPWWEEANPIPPAGFPRLERGAPDLVLISQGGDTLDLRAFRKQPVIVTFAYAHCTTICPVVVQDALRAQDALRGTAHQPVLLVVTLDPWRDTPSRLAAIAQSWGFAEPGAHVLSGSVADVEAVLDRWEVPRSRNQVTGDVTHPALLYVVDGEGTLAYASTGGVDAIVSLVQRL